MVEKMEKAEFINECRDCLFSENVVFDCTYINENKEFDFDFGCIDSFCPKFWKMIKIHYPKFIRDRITALEIRLCAEARRVEGENYYWEKELIEIRKKIDQIMKEDWEESHRKKYDELAYDRTCTYEQIRFNRRKYKIMGEKLRFLWSL